MKNITCINITEYNATCYDYAPSVQTTALVALIVCPFSIAGCLLNIVSDGLYYYAKRKLSFFHKCVLNIASCNLCSSVCLLPITFILVMTLQIIYLIQASLIRSLLPIPSWLCYLCGFLHEFFNHTSVAFTALFALQVLLKVRLCSDSVRIQSFYSPFNDFQFTVVYS
jgi:hypothetical protein